MHQSARAAQRAWAPWHRGQARWPLLRLFTPSLRSLVARASSLPLPPPPAARRPARRAMDAGALEQAERLVSRAYVSQVRAPCVPHVPRPPPHPTPLHPTPPIPPHPPTHPPTQPDTRVFTRPRAHARMILFRPRTPRSRAARAGCRRACPPWRAHQGAAVRAAAATRAMARARARGAAARSGVNGLE